MHCQNTGILQMTPLIQKIFHFVRIPKLYSLMTYTAVFKKFFDQENHKRNSRSCVTLFCFEFQADRAWKLLNIFMVDKKKKNNKNFGQRTSTGNRYFVLFGFLFFGDFVWQSHNLYSTGLKSYKSVFFLLGTNSCLKCEQCSNLYSKQ